MPYPEYSYNMDAHREGSIVNTEDKLIVSMTNEGTDVIGYGKPVSRGTLDDSAKATAAGDEVFGITVRERSGTVDGWKQYQSMRVMLRGVIAVPVTTAVVAGEDVHVDLAAGTYSNAGGATMTNAKFDSSQPTVGGLAVVRMT